MVDSKELRNPLLLKPKEKFIFQKRENRPVLDSIENKPAAARKSIEVNAKKITEPPANKVLENINTEESTSWKSGILLFNKEDLASLTKKLERKYDIKFIFKSEELKNYSFSGTLRDFPLEQVLHALKLTAPINYSINEKVVTLSYNKDFKGTYSNDYKVSN